MLTRPLRACLSLGATLALAVSAMGPGATVASAACADPNNNCPNGGLVTFPTPVPAQPRSAPCADPNNNCPNGGQVTFPTPVPSQPRMPCADPTGNCPNNGQSDAPNPNPYGPGGVPTVAGLSVQINPVAGAAGDTIAVVGQGFSANGRGNLIFINVVDANGNRFDTNYKPISCVDSEDWLLNLYQDLGWGCSGNSSGALINSNGDGAFAAAFAVPDGIAAGQGQVCIASVFSNPVCTPLMIQDGAGG